MERIEARSVEELYHGSKGREVYIYGAKTIAQRACYYLKSQGIETRAYVVSDKHENPDYIQEKEVLRIEKDVERTYDCMIIAISGQFLWEVEEELRRYHINRIIVIHPVMADEFPTSCILSDKSIISPKAFLGDKVQIFADETSVIRIDDNVVLKAGAVILATGNSEIHLMEGACIGEKALLSADNRSQISLGKQVRVEEKVHMAGKDSSKLEIGDRIFLGENTSLNVKKESKIYIGEKSEIGKSVCVTADEKSQGILKSEVVIGSESTLLMSEASNLVIGENSVIGKCGSLSVSLDSELYLKGENRIGSNSIIYGAHNAHISIGEKSTINGYLYMGADNSTIDIGEDNMFSLYIVMNVGSHRLIDDNTGREITNYKPIRTGKHVWVGMHATLLPGCEIGDGAVVGAAAVVNSQIPSKTCCVGNTARVVRSNVEWERE